MVNDSIPKAFAIAICSIVDTIGTEKSVVPIAAVVSRKSYVRFPSDIEKCGKPICGNPLPIDPIKQYYIILYFFLRFFIE